MLTGSLSVKRLMQQDHHEFQPHVINIASSQQAQVTECHRSLKPNEKAEFCFYFFFLFSKDLLNNDQSVLKEFIIVVVVIIT